ncbi:MAG: hypothetical protein DCF26_16730 [Burkholderiales bacterium]|nr:MAG: hypothetical protein DCF26_16730 [Burkholderiales bacterium]
MKIRLVTIAFWIGLFVLIGPWVLLAEPSRYWLITSAVGGVLTSIAGYNAHAKMMGMGEPGEELLHSWWLWFKSKLNRIPKDK